jgi:hypothetical protein
MRVFSRFAGFRSCSCFSRDLRRIGGCKPFWAREPCQDPGRPPITGGRCSRPRQLETSAARRLSFVRPGGSVTIDAGAIIRSLWSREWPGLASPSSSQLLKATASPVPVTVAIASSANLPILTDPRGRLPSFPIAVRGVRREERLC